MSTFSEFYDLRLVAVYDTLNPIAEYERFYLDPASRISASSIVDIGCGTGLLTRELAMRGHRVVASSPRVRCSMLRGTRWLRASAMGVEGDARCLDEVGADLKIDGDLVRYDIHYLFTSSGEELVSTSELRFRSRNELGGSLSDAGFTVGEVFGDWDGHPADATSQELIFMAARG